AIARPAAASQLDPRHPDRRPSLTDRPCCAWRFGHARRRRTRHGPVPENGRPDRPKYRSRLMALELVQGDFDAFFATPFHVYGKDTPYVSPMRSDLKKYLDAAQ